MTITPEQAASWLASANTSNRRLREPYAQRIARDIVAGKWKVTHQGIAFSPNSVLLDGQHRLRAIVIANKPVQMYVAFGFDRDTMPAIDGGNRRRLADVMTLEGGLGHISPEEVAVMNAMFDVANTKGSLTGSEAMELFRVHGNAVRFACGNIPKRIRGISADVRAVVARAFYSQDHEKLKRFCQVLMTGVAKRDEEQPVALLYQFLVTHPANGGRSSGRERYYKAERALDAFVRGETLGRLYAAASELFPVPGELVPNRAGGAGESE